MDAQQRSVIEALIAKDNVYVDPYQKAQLVLQLAILDVLRRVENNLYAQNVPTLAGDLTCFRK
jgi:hypothetical protein